MDGFHCSSHSQPVQQQIYGRESNFISFNNPAPFEDEGGGVCYNNASSFLLQLVCSSDPTTYNN